MQLGREILDKEILDCAGFKGGKVDDVLLELRAGKRPVVRAIVTQHGALARLLGPTLAGLGALVRARLLALGPEVTPVEIGWEHVIRIDVAVHIDLDRKTTGLMRSEEAVWERWISHLPLARR